MFYLIVDLSSDEDDKDSVQSEEEPKTPEVKDVQHRVPSPVYTDKTKDNNKCVDTINTDRDQHVLQRAANVFKPAAFAPGRLNNLEILERVFPLHRRSVLELVLQGCNGDLVKAIEQFISAQDTIDAHGKIESSQKAPVRYNPYSTPASWIHGSNTTYGTSMPTPLDLKSAFKPLPMPAISGLHSAFLSGYPSLTSAAGQLSTPFNAGQYSTATFGLPLPHGAYTGMHGYSGLFNTPFSLLPYRAGEPRDLTKMANRETLSTVDKKQ